MVWFLPLVILIAILAYPWLRESLRRPVGRAERREAPGQFAELSDGMTHYRWSGPQRGPVAVLVHGLTTPSPVWDQIAQMLGDIGYRVLVYDLYNRGYSDRVRGPHDKELYLRQLDELLEDQGLQDSLTIVGYSMGGMIATAFAATEPHRMQRLILLATAGVETTESRFSTFCRTKPVIGDWLHGLLAGRRMAAAIRADKAAKAAPSVRDAQLAELKRKGFLSGVLAARRDFLNDQQEAEHRAITRDGIPTIAIWGEADEVIPVTATGKLAQWNRKAHHEVIKGAGHALPYSHAQEVSTVLRAMLREQIGG